MFLSELNQLMLEFFYQIQLTVVSLLFIVILELSLMLITC